MVNAPDPLVVASRFKPVPLLVAVTCAPGTTALFGSVTVPPRVAVEDWAWAAKGKARRAKGKGLRFMMLSSRNQNLEISSFVIYHLTVVIWSFIGGQSLVSRSK